MTITYVGNGTSGTGNNASVVAGAITGIAVDDLVLMPAIIRSTTAAPVTPTGWTKMVDLGNVVLFGRFWQTGDALPTVSFTGGVANADTFVRAHAFRGVSKDQLTPDASASLTNVSAQNIAYPALDVLTDKQATFLFAWKQDDCTSVGTPVGWTAAYTTNQTTGDDMSQSAYYQIQTTATDLAANSLTVTGGVAAVSKSFAIALKPAAAIAVQTQDVYPPRVLISVTGLTLGDSVEIFRSVGSVRTLVRASEVEAVTDPSVLKIDAELPFGVPVTYVAVINGSVELSAGPTTYSLADGADSVPVLTDAINGTAAEVAIGAMPERKYSRQRSVFNVGGRNVVVSGPLGMYESTIEFPILSASSVDNFYNLLETATQGIVQLRNASGTISDYLAVLDVTERLWSQDGPDERRLMIVDVVQVEGWADALEAVGFTYQDVADYYAPSGTYADAAAEFATYLAAAQGDYT